MVRTSWRRMLRMGLVAVVATALIRSPATTTAFSTKLSAAVGRSATAWALCASNRNRQPQSPSSSNNNPSFSTMIGDMASSILGNSKSPDRRPELDAKLDRMGPSWEAVRAQLEAQQQTAQERQFPANLARGFGVGSPLHRVRLFDESNKEEDIRVTFYRDSASWCPYCQKVWMTLEEKKIPYRIEKVNMRCYGDKPPEFTRMQPSGQIPVAIVDGRVYGQSNDILAQLEDEQAFGEYKSLRPEPAQEARAQQLLRLERQIFSAWMYWLTGGGEQSKRSYLETLEQVERALQQSGPFFMGNTVTLVDFQYAPFLERMAASLLYYKGFQMRVAPGVKTDYPAINRWFDAMETLPSYQLTKSDYYTHCWDLPPQLGGCVMEAGGAPYERAINGERTLDGTRGSWEWPLEPHLGGVEPDWAWAASDDATAQREAVERVSANFDAIVKFAARGAGRKGMPPVSAPLADPNAVPSPAVEPSVSAVLRIVCTALLDGSPEKQDGEMNEIAKTIVEAGGPEFASSVVDSLAYMRDRVGVPRDMKLPAARQLRAFLNWSIAAILDAVDQ